MKNSLYWLLKTVSYLEIGFLTVLAIVISNEAVMARPLCYLIDAYGRSINLSYMCVNKPTTVNATNSSPPSVTSPVNNSLPPTQTSPGELPTNSDRSSTEDENTNVDDLNNDDRNNDDLNNNDRNIDNQTNNDRNVNDNQLTQPTRQVPILPK